MVDDALISGIDISYTYPDGTKGFERLTVHIWRGEKIALIGPNGCGKSTLMMVLAGLLKPDTGKVLIDGKDVFQNAEKIRRMTGFVFQDPDVFLFNPSVEDELRYSLNQLDISAESIDELIIKFSEIFELNSILSKPPFRLSGGEKKRVEIASVLIYNPDILFLDEPTANVDGKTRRKILEIFDSYSGTLILSTHEIDIAKKISDRIIIMNHEKKIVYNGGKEILREKSFLEEVGII